MPQVNEISWFLISLKFFSLIFILFCSFNYIFNFSLNLMFLEKNYSFNLFI